MKKGKSCVLKGYKNFKTSYGTVDSKNLKSIYINIQSWVEPKIFSEDWTKQISYFSKIVKQLLTDVIDNFIFLSKFIVDMDLRSSGITLGKRSFMNLEITLFTKEYIDFKSIKLRNSVKDIILNIQKEIFNNSEIFNFHLTKLDNSINLHSV
jgi:hypothetical protein